MHHSLQSTGLALLLAFVLPAHARWDNVGLWRQGAFYLDRTTLEKSGDFRKVSTMLDYRVPQKNQLGKTFRSTRSLLHIDCKKEDVRTLHLSMYAGQMLTGELVESEGILAEWQPVPADTPMHRIIWTVC